MQLDISWNSPLGVAVFFLGLGVFFWGLSQWVKLWIRRRE